MKFDEAGTYKIEYTATDGCGNSTTEDRLVEVMPPPRTVLYTDGTFIINESPADRATNEALHGAATNEYIPFNPNGATNVEKYIFTYGSAQPWVNNRSSIRNVLIGDRIEPTDMSYWFYTFRNCTSIDLTNIITTHVTKMYLMCSDCESLTTFIPPNSTAPELTSVESMFMSCSLLENIDLSWCNSDRMANFKNFAANDRNLKTVDLTGLSGNIINTDTMFNNCSGMTTIYASPAFSLATGATSSVMFGHMSSRLVGGAGTVWSSSNPIDGTYAHIDGGTSNPGYFTVKA